MCLSHFAVSSLPVCFNRDKKVVDVMCLRKYGRRCGRKQM